MMTVSGVEFLAKLSFESILDLFGVGVVTLKSSKMSSSRSSRSLSLENKNCRFLVDSGRVLVLEVTDRTGSGHRPAFGARLGDLILVRVECSGF